MLKYRLKCVKNNTCVNPKGYLSGTRQIFAPALHDNLRANSGQKWAIFAPVAQFLLTHVITTYH